MNAHITRRTFLGGASVLGMGALAAACGQAAPAMDEKAEMAPEQKEEAKAEAEAPAGPQGEALYWHRGFFDFEPWAKEFAELNPGLTMNAVGEADRLNKFKAAVAAGSPPDAVDVGDWQTVELGVTDISQPLNNYYKASGVLDLSEFWPSVLSYLTDAPTGNMYGAPYAPDLRVMYIHGDTYLEVGLDPENPPSSWTDFDTAIIQTTKFDGDTLVRAGCPPFWGSGGTGLWLLLLWQLGGDVMSDDWSEVTINSQEAVRALDWLRNIHEVQGGWDAIAQLRGDGLHRNSHLAEARAVHYYATFAERGQWFKENAPDLNFGFTPWPKPEGGKDANLGGNHTATFAINAPNPDAMFAWVEYFLSADTNLRFAKQYDRVPVREATTSSPEYTENDPFRELIAQQMPFRHFYYSGPGGTEARTHAVGFVPDVMAGTITAPEALEAAEKGIAELLAGWNERLGR